MSKYILFRNQRFAKTLAKKIGAVVCYYEDDLFGISPQDGDTIIVDAHYKGSMSDMSGIQIVKKLQKYECKDKDVKFKILSWFPPEWFDEKPDWKNKKKQLFSQNNVDFVQLPVSDIKLLTI